MAPVCLKRYLFGKIKHSNRIQLSVLYGALLVKNCACFVHLSTTKYDVKPLVLALPKDVEGIKQVLPLNPSEVDLETAIATECLT